MPQILLLCRANQCRSPFAAEIARRRAEGLSLNFESAGLLPGGQPMPRTGQVVALTYGYDFSRHVSRELDTHDAADFDVVLTMARDQSRDLVAENPDVWPRVFTLKQFDRWLDTNAVPLGVELGEWLSSAAAGRSRSELLGSDPDDDVADPLMEPASAWHRMVAELDSVLDRVLRKLA